MTCATAVTEGVRPGVKSSLVPIKSEEDEREYKVVTLANELVVMLVRDKDTDKAAAAMNVAVGHFSDPETLAGLAHFLEHMLFLGTEKYPVENEYHSFLAAHSGRYNAYTSMEETNYFFDVAHEHLEQALDRFAQFFTAPLFTPGATERELQAVNNEHVKNLENDHWRLFQLSKSTANPQHPFSKFGTGDLQTLRDTPRRHGIDIRSALLTFHDRYYSSNVSTLCILGREPMETLEAWAVEKFSSFANKNVSVPSFPSDAYRPENLTSIIKVVPVKDLRSMQLQWLWPALGTHYHTKPSCILSHLLGHEAKGAILQLLKVKGWANELRAGDSQNATSFSIFQIDIALTEEGLDRVNDIVLIVYQYLRMLSAASDDEWRRVFQEVNVVSETNFRFSDKVEPFEYVQNITQALHRYPAEEALCGGWLLRELRLDVVKDFLGCLLSTGVRVQVVSQAFKGKTNLKERWYGTDYSLEPLPSDLLSAITSIQMTVDPNLQLPDRNEFIATDFALKNGDRQLKPGPPAAPTLLKLGRDLEALIKCWWKMDNTFFKPQAHVLVKIDTPVCCGSPEAAVLTSLFTMLLKDSLVTFAYNAEIASLSYDINRTDMGLELVFRGYSHKLPLLARRVLEQIRGFESRIDAARFALLKEAMVRDLANFELEQPYQQAQYSSGQCLQHPVCHYKEQLAVSTTLTPDHLRHHVKAMMEGGSAVEMLVYGNMDETEARSVCHMVKDVLELKPLTPPMIPEVRAVRLDDSTHHFLEATCPNLQERNSAALVTFQLGPDSVSMAARALLLAHLLREPCFNQRVARVLYLHVMVQSGNKPAHHLTQRIMAFLENDLKVLLAAMPDEVFKKMRESVVKDLEEKVKNMWEESNRHWDEIFHQRYQFSRRLASAETIKQLHQTDVVAFLDQYIWTVNAAASRVRRLTIQLSGHIIPPSDPDQEREILSVEPAQPVPAHDVPPQSSLQLIVVIRNGAFAEFRRSMSLYPDMRGRPQEEPVIASQLNVAAVSAVTPTDEIDRAVNELTRPRRRFFSKFAQDQVQPPPSRVRQGGLVVAGFVAGLVAVGLAGWFKRSRL